MGKRTNNDKVYKWSAIDKIGNTIITFAGVMILTRLLGESARADFGLVAIVWIFTSLAQDFSSCGLSDGLIYKKDATPEDFSTVFVFNASMGALFALLFISISGVVADFFGHIELKYIMWVLAVCFFFQSLSYVQETRLRKQLNLKCEALVRLSATLTVTILGGILAWKGFGYWAVVSTQILLFFFIFLYYLIATRWFPKIQFSKKSFREMFSYGFPLMQAYLGNIISQRINTFVLGKFSAVSSGVYSQAQKLIDAPNAIVQQTFNGPLFAILSNEKDPQVRNNLTLNMYLVIFLAYTSLGMLLMIISKPAILFLYGDYWKDAIPVFRCLIFFAIAQGLKLFFQTIFKSHGHPKKIRNLSFLEIGLQFGAMALVIWLSPGIVEFALTQVFATMSVMFIYASYFVKFERISWRTICGVSLKLLVIPGTSFAIVGLGYIGWNNYIPDFLNCVISSVGFISIGLITLRKVDNSLFNQLISRFRKNKNVNVDANNCGILKEINSLRNK